MKEGLPDTPPQNSSIYNIEGDLLPSFSFEEGGFNRYVDEDDQIHYRISDQPKKQFVISELAALMMPVAIVFKKDAPKEWPAHFSPNIHKHPNYNSEHQFISLVDKSLLEILFRDGDHLNIHNHKGSVFYDFGLGNVNQTGSEKSITALAEDIYNDFEEHEKLLQLPELISKLQTFRTHIEGESGFAFIVALVKKANYTDIPPKQIQQSLLSRCDLSLTVFMRKTTDNTSNA